MMLSWSPSTTKIGVRRWRRIGSLLVLASLPAALGGCAARSPLYYEYLEPAKAPAAFEQQGIDDSLAATRAKLIAGLYDADQRSVLQPRGDRLIRGRTGLEETLRDLVNAQPAPAGAGSISTSRLPEPTTPTRLACVTGRVAPWFLK